MALYLILIIPTIILGLWAQHRVGSTYKKFAQVRSRSGITGAEAAKYVMQQAGIRDVSIHPVQGHLTDHYDPNHKRLCLSEENFRGTSLAALGVAAHEAGHAIQHKNKYSMLQARMALIPATSFASQILPFAIIGGFLFHFTGLILLGVVAYAILTVFQLITLPVEFDASKRAVVQLDSLGIIDGDELPGVKKTLNAAAWTYVAAFISSLAWLLYFILASRR
ncbi:MAG: zinc metallopeptidase [Verrucomicrobiota bacterium]